MGTETKRAWKLQEFVAHAGQVNCLALGHKSGRVMVTGGDDKKVNMWAVGKPNCIMSLSGHTSPIEAVRFGNAEEMVVAGSMSGALKIWDLEQAKIMRTLTGHKAGIRSLDFHPYGDYVSSGAMDTNIRLWDIRRKGCIYTYKGHSDAVNVLRFSPDGKWLASGGQDSCVKIWDLTAGKQLIDLKSHSGPVNSIEFHPSEFLLGTASSDRTVKMWDLESFQEVSSTDGNTSSIRSIFFHPDGLCLYGAVRDQIKVYGWEPAETYDTVHVNFGDPADIAIAQNQLIAASWLQNSVSTYVVDIKKVQPIGGEPDSPPKVATGRLNTSSGRKSFLVNRPHTQSSKSQEVPKEAEQEDDVPVEDPGDDESSFAQITNQDDYNSIFHPRKQLQRENLQGPGQKNVHQHPFTPPEKDKTPSVSEAPSPPRKSTSSRAQTSHNQRPASHAKPTTAVQRPPSNSKLSQPTQETPAEPQPSSTRVNAAGDARPYSRDRPQSKARPASEQSRKPTPAVDLDMQEFLPKKDLPEFESLNGNMSEAIEAIMNGCKSMNLVLSSRHRNLQVVRALWTGGNVKTAVDSAVSMGDLAIIVDLLNVLQDRPSLWNLDLASVLLPQINELLSSKYESYAASACDSLKIVLRNFAPVIKSNMAMPAGVGVDISREERQQKCKLCYGHLMMIRSKLGERSFSAQSKMAGKIKEINLLMSQLD